MRMSNEIDVNILSMSLEEYFDADSVSMASRQKLDNTDILALPNKYAEHEYYFAQETADFIKYCRQNDSQHSFDILADQIKVRSLHSFDIWMPVLWVGKNILLPIIVGLVANYIHDKIKGREKEDVNVEITFIVKNKKKEKTLHYRGDAKQFEEKFEKIDLTKL